MRLGLKVHFVFSSYFKTGSALEGIPVVVDGDMATLADALDLLFAQNTELHDKFNKMKLTIDGKLTAMYVLDGNLIQPETSLPDGGTIKVMAPICGG